MWLMPLLFFILKFWSSNFLRCIIVFLLYLYLRLWRYLCPRCILGPVSSVGSFSWFFSLVCLPTTAVCIIPWTRGFYFPGVTWHSYLKRKVSRARSYTYTMTPALSDDLKTCIVSWYFEEGLTYREIRDRADWSTGLISKVLGNYRKWASLHPCCCWCWISSRYRAGFASMRLEMYSTSLSSIFEGLPVRLLNGLVPYVAQVRCHVTPGNKISVFMQLCKWP